MVTLMLLWPDCPSNSLFAIVWGFFCCQPMTNDHSSFRVFLPKVLWNHSCACFMSVWVRHLLTSWQPAWQQIVFFEEQRWNLNHLSFYSQLVLRFSSRKGLFMLAWQWNRRRSRLVHRESDLMFILSSDKDQRKKFAFAFIFAKCKWTSRGRWSLNGMSVLTGEGGGRKLEALRDVQTRRSRCWCHLSTLCVDTPPRGWCSRWFGPENDEGKYVNFQINKKASNRMQTTHLDAS